MPKSPRKRSTKKRKVKKSKNRKRINDGTNDSIVKHEDVTIIMPTKAQEFYQLYLRTSGKPFGTLDFSSLTIKIGEELKTFGSEGLPVSVKGEVLLKDGKHIYAFTLDNYYKTTYWKDIPFFEGNDVVDFVQKK